MAKNKIKKSSNSYWFKRRRYGWGYTPVTWQGWLVIVTFVLGLISAARKLPDDPSVATEGQMIKFFATIGIAVAILVAISLITGPKPRWRWGKKPSDNQDEDY